MDSSNSKLGSLIVQLNNRIDGLKETFDQILDELERQKVENEKQYQNQLEQLKEERRKWDEEKAIMGKLPPSTSPIVNLNVGGEKMSTSRATLVLIEGSLLATMFSGKCEDNLMKDKTGCIFLDYDPAVSRNFCMYMNKYFNLTSNLLSFLPRLLSLKISLLRNLITLFLLTLFVRSCSNVF